MGCFLLPLLKSSCYIIIIIAIAICEKKKFSKCDYLIIRIVCLNFVSFLSKIATFKKSLKAIKVEASKSFKKSTLSFVSDIKIKILIQVTSITKNKKLTFAAIWKKAIPENFDIFINHNP